MYDNLRGRLKELAKIEPVDDGMGIFRISAEGLEIIKGLATEAEAAIEDLSRRKTPMKITEIHVDEYYCPACGAENNCDQGHVQDAYCPVCGQRLLPQPPKDEAPAGPYDLLYEEGGPDTR